MVFTLFLIAAISFSVFVIEFVVPANHIVSKSSSFKLSPKKLWRILTNITDYPRWQSKVEAVNIDKADPDQDQVVFVEYSTSKRHTVIQQHDAVYLRRLVRIIQDYDSLTENYQFQKKLPSFLGTWTLDIIPSQGDESLVLKITQQGTIKNPIVRVFHRLVLGYAYRIDRFFNDLYLFIEKEGESLVEAPGNSLDGSFSIPQDLISPLDLSVVTANNYDTNWSIQEERQDAFSTLAPKDTLQTENSIHKNEADDTYFDQEIEATDGSLINTKTEWDFVSEIYQRPDEDITST